MARDAGGGQGKSKPEMIREVLEESPELTAPRVRTAVWERYGGEVTTQEIARVRQKLREARAEDRPAEKPPAAPPRKPREARHRSPEGPSRRTKTPKPDIRSKDFADAQVTVQQLSAILEVADEVGGLRRLREALDTVLRLRAKVGEVDERQLAYALDFLARLTGRGR
jgi:hypothetical protein